MEGGGIMELFMCSPDDGVEPSLVEERARTDKSVNCRLLVADKCVGLSSNVFPRMERRSACFVRLSAQAV